MAAKKYTREALIQAPVFSKYQRDFLGVVLRKSEYPIAKAENAAKAFFDMESD